MKWIVVSGLDGSGKTTLVGNLQKWISDECELRVKRSRLPHDQHLVKDLLNISTSPYTDRMIFSLDNRIFAERYRKWSESGMYDVLLTQRGYLDSFVHGAVQGFSYSWIAENNQIADLPRCFAMIHLVAEAEVAYSRIRDDPDADKFEYLEYIRRQEFETRRAYHQVGNNVDLIHFRESKNILIDTTRKTTEETFEIARNWLEGLLKH